MNYLKNKKELMMESESYIKLNRQELHNRLYPGYPAQSDNVLILYVKKKCHDTFLSKIESDYKRYLNSIPFWKKLFGLKPKKLTFREWVVLNVRQYHYYFFWEERHSFRHLFNLYNNSKDYIYLSSQHLDDLIHLESDKYSEINNVVLTDDQQFVVDLIVDRHRFKNIK